MQSAFSKLGQLVQASQQQQNRFNDPNRRVQLLRTKLQPSMDIFENQKGFYNIVFFAQEKS
jgi:hypothetical protein